MSITMRGMCFFFYAEQSGNGFNRHSVKHAVLVSPSRGADDPIDSCYDSAAVERLRAAILLQYIIWELASQVQSFLKN